MLLHAESKDRDSWGQGALSGTLETGGHHSGLGVL